MAAPLRARSAFTIVELLVVITIIVVLLSMLVPSLERAFDSAQTAICMSNFKNLGTATRMYLNEYVQTFMNHRGGGNTPPDDGDGDTAPGSGVRETDGTKEKWWATDLFKYGMAPPNFECAAIKGSGRTDYGRSWQPAFNQDFVSYGYNSWFLGVYPNGYDPYWTEYGFKAHDVVQPSNNLVFGESHPMRDAPYWSQSMWWWNSSTTNVAYNEGVSVNRHRRGSAVSFVDGRVEIMRSPDINPNDPDVRWDPNSIRYWDPRQRPRP